MTLRKITTTVIKCLVHTRARALTMYNIYYRTIVSLSMSYYRIRIVCPYRYVQEESQERPGGRDDDRSCGPDGHGPAQGPGDDPQGNGSRRVRLREGVRRVRRGSGPVEKEPEQERQGPDGLGENHQVGIIYIIQNTKPNRLHNSTPGRETNSRRR